MDIPDRTGTVRNSFVVPIGWENGLIGYRIYLDERSVADVFGKRLPEVARSLGKGIVEFKKGVRGIEDEVNAPPTTETQSLERQPAPSPPIKIGRLLADIAPAA
ncbi:MAG: DUF4861 family protein [Rhodomicrobium sp.]|nr:DUF4861 family protein [Rhodomicrobium sp.]